MKINNIMQKGAILLALAVSTNSIAYDIEDKYSFVKEKLVEDKKCEECLTLTKPTAIFNEDKTIFSYKANVEKSIFTDINIPEGFKVENIAIDGENVDYFWNNDNTLMISVDEGIHRPRSRIEPPSSVSAH